ncbi:glycosyltransferase family 2 protein [Catenovulum agarivorans]|uniref:glycosyltransferase family 2 protein n=1 Tax=Catenovulum agarivorans TaxID=1172192 RepID=UPI0002E26932|nr:glycosyltransferase family 2 protein [Catenovulum agarivorans]
MPIKISIITATYNSAKTVVDAIKSVNAQTYQNIEHIIIDGGSKDDTVDVVKRSGERIGILISEPDKGIYDALNKGINAATGDVIGFMHSDDIFADEHAVAQIVKAFEDSQADSVYADLDYVQKNDTTKVVRKWISGDFKFEKLKSGWMPPHPTFYMKREKYQLLGGFDLSYRIAADYDSILRYLWKGKVSTHYIPEVLVKMRVGGASNRSLKNIIQKSKEDKLALKTNGLPWLRALTFKNLSKIPQFLKK